MFISNTPDALAPETPPATATSAGFIPPTSPQTAEPNRIRHMLFGNLATVQATIRHLHKLNYAEPNDWSQPISTGRPNEVMAILTKRIG